MNQGNIINNNENLEENSHSIQNTSESVESTQRKRGRPKKVKTTQDGDTKKKRTSKKGSIKDSKEHKETRGRKPLTDEQKRRNALLFLKRR